MSDDCAIVWVTIGAISVVLLLCLFHIFKFCIQGIVEEAVRASLSHKKKWDEIIKTAEKEGRPKPLPPSRMWNDTDETK